MNYRSFRSFLGVAHSYEKHAQTVDPTQLQVGESVYDGTDSEYVVVENDPTKTNVVLMPADQARQPVPEGVTSVEETDLGSYTVQPTNSTTTARKASTEVDWDEIQSAALDVLVYARRQDAKDFVEALDYLNFLFLGHTELPEDADLSSMFQPSGRKVSDFGPLAEFDKNIEMEVEDTQDVQSGESGYTAIMRDIRDMVAEDVPVVDLILAVGEKYPRSMGEKALADARSRGIL